MTYGFSYAGHAIATFHPDAGCVNAHIYLELIAPREQLELFVKQIAPIIVNRSITYSESEDWTPAAADTAPALVP